MWIKDWFQSLSPLKHFVMMLWMLQIADWCWRHGWSTSLHDGHEPIDFTASRMTIDCIYLSEVANDTWDQHDFCQTDWMVCMVYSSWFIRLRMLTANHVQWRVTCSILSDHTLAILSILHARVEMMGVPEGSWPH